MKIYAAHQTAVAAASALRAVKAPEATSALAWPAARRRRAAASVGSVRRSGRGIPR